MWYDNGSLLQIFLRLTGLCWTCLQINQIWYHVILLRQGQSPMMIKQWCFHKILIAYIKNVQKVWSHHVLCSTCIICTVLFLQISSNAVSYLVLTYTCTITVTVVLTYSVSVVMGFCLTYQLEKHYSLFKKRFKLGDWIMSAVLCNSGKWD